MSGISHLGVQPAWAARPVGLSDEDAMGTLAPLPRLTPFCFRGKRHCPGPLPRPEPSALCPAGPTARTASFQHPSTHSASQPHGSPGEASSQQPQQPEGPVPSMLSRPVLPPPSTVHAQCSRLPPTQYHPRSVLPSSPHPVLSMLSPPTIQYRPRSVPPFTPPSRVLKTRLAHLRPLPGPALRGTLCGSTRPLVM